MQEDTYGDGYEIHVNPVYGRNRFSHQELIDITVSMIVLTIAFVVLQRELASSSYFISSYGNTCAWAVLFIICFVLVLVSFLLHEFGHKFTAQKYGMWSEYRMYPAGLVLTLVTSIFGFLFAAPGAVYIRGYMDREKNGKVSMAGPIVNIVLAAVSVVIIAVLLIITTSSSDMTIMTGTEYMVYLVFSMMLSLNALLAVFNLIPFPPLDGSKIFPWNKKVWAIMFVIAIAEIMYYFLCMPNTIWLLA